MDFPKREEKNKIYYIYLLTLLSLTILISLVIIIDKDSNFVVGNEAKKKYEYVDYDTEPKDDIFLCSEYYNSIGSCSKAYSKGTQQHYSKDDFNILVLGDSFTGDYPYPKKKYPQFLEEKLKNEVSENINVINMAVGGASMSDKLQTLKRSEKKINPDITIIQYLHDDWRNTTQICLNFKRMLKKYCRKHDKYTRGQIKQLWFKSYTKGNIREGLMPALNKINKYNKKIDIIFLIPLKEKWLKLWPQKEHIDEVKKYVRNLNWTILDMDNFYRKYGDSKLKVAENNYHPSTFAHKLIAERLSKIIKDEYSQQIK